MGACRPKHVEWLCRNKTCTALHQVGVSFDLYCDARKHKIKRWVTFIDLTLLRPNLVTTLLHRPPFLRDRPLNQRTAIATSRVYSGHRTSIEWGFNRSWQALGKTTIFQHTVPYNLTWTSGWFERPSSGIGPPRNQGWDIWITAASWKRVKVSFYSERLSNVAKFSDTSANEDNWFRNHIR